MPSLLARSSTHPACLPLQALPLAPADGAAASSAAVDSWLEWEERCLRPAAYGCDAAALKAALQQLGEGLAGRKHLVGGQLSLADCCVYATLRPLLTTNAQVRRVHAFKLHN